MIIAFTGLAQSGKDTAANYLSSKHGFAHTSFATALKRTVRVKFNLSTRQTDTKEGKEEFVPAWGMTVREILQREGTEATKTFFGQDFWLKRWFMNIEYLRQRGCTRVTVSDARFPVEAKFVRAQGYPVVRIVRPGHDNGLSLAERSHESEQPLPSSLVDYEIVNDGSLQDLYDRLDTLLEVLGEGHGR